MASLAVSNLAVSVPGRKLLERVHLHLAAGDRVSVQGPSGCGKTTLLRAIAGLVDATAGTVTLDGRAPAELGWPCWRRRVTYVAQQPVLFAGTVRQNLTRPFQYRSADRPLSEKDTQAWLVRLGLDLERLEQNADSLSVGEQQRVALLRALAISPAVVLLDEPTSALDEEARAEVEALLRERCEQAGLAVLLVSHEAAQAERLCEQTLDLRAHAIAGSQGKTLGPRSSAARNAEVDDA